MHDLQPSNSQHMTTAKERGMNTHCKRLGRCLKAMGLVTTCV